MKKITRTTCVIDIGTIAKILGIDDINFKDYRLVPFHRCRNPGKRSEIQRRDETGICTIHEGVQICRSEPAHGHSDVLRRKGRKGH